MPGKPAASFATRARPDEQELPSKVSRPRIEGVATSMRIETPGGGGAGAPEQRTAERVSGGCQDWEGIAGQALAPFLW